MGKELPPPIRDGENEAENLSDSAQITLLAMTPGSPPSLSPSLQCGGLLEDTFRYSWVGGITSGGDDPAGLLPL